jgi:hypothetical protein
MTQFEPVRFAVRGEASITTRVATSSAMIETRLRIPVLLGSKRGISLNLACEPVHLAKICLKP